MAYKKMTPETISAKSLKNHIKYDDGGYKTVCVSTCLTHLGIDINSYKYTSTAEDREHFLKILQKNHFDVKDIAAKLGFGATIFKILTPSLTDIRKALKKSDIKKSENILVLAEQRKRAHLILLNGNGDRIIDTAPGRRWRVEKVFLIAPSNRDTINKFMEMMGYTTIKN